MSPKNPDMDAELRALQEQVRALTAAQAARAAAECPPCAEQEAETAPPAIELPDFDELVASLKREVEDVHPMTCIAIFGLGVLTGRLLAAKGA